MAKIDTIGLISDTHGLLRPEALAVLQPCRLILHGGDVGSPAILESLNQIAPTLAVRGNCDHGLWALDLPLSEVVELERHTLYMLHDLDMLDVEPAAAGFDAVIYGHSHMPSAESRNGVLYLNPGSAGPRRFKLPVSVALLEVDEGQLRPRLIELQV